MNRLSKYLALVLICVATPSFAGSFDLEQSFPNYFKQHTEASLIEQVVISSISRLATPPDAPQYLSGRSVSWILGNIYRQIYRAKQKNPNLETSTILQGLLSAKASPAIGVDRKLQYSSFRSPQFGNSLHQLDIDWRAKKFVSPKKDAVFTAFAKGFYSYQSGGSQLLAEELQSSAVEGFTPLLTIPFLKLDPEGEQALFSDLERVLDQVKAEGRLLAGPTQLFKDAVKNSWMGGSQGRFYNSNGRIESRVLEISEAVGRPTEKEFTLLPKFLVSVDPRTREIVDHKLDPLLMSVDRFNREWTDHGIFYHGTALANLPAILQNGFIPSTQSQGQAAYGRGVYAAGKGQYKVASSWANWHGHPGFIFNFKLDPQAPVRILNWPEVQGRPELYEIARQAESTHLGLFEFLNEVYGVDLIINGGDLLIQNPAVLIMPKTLKKAVLQQAEVMENKLFRDQEYVRLLSSGPNPNDQEYLDKVGTDFPNYVALYRLAQSSGYSGLPAPDDVFMRAVQKFDPAFHSVQNSIQKTVELGLSQKSDPVLRQFVASALSVLDEGPREKKLESAFADPDPKVAANAGRVLAGMTGSPHFLELVKSALHFKGSSYRLGTYAVEALLQYSGSNSQEAIHILAGEIDASYNCSDIPIRKDWVSGLLNQPSAKVKKCAAESLDTGLVPRQRLGQALMDPAEKVRLAAVRALLFHSGRDHLKWVSQALKDPSPDVGEQAGYCLLTLRPTATSPQTS